MSFCWDNYIQLAEELLDNSKNNIIEEAYLRTSISRSYYGVFCLARNYLINIKQIQIPVRDTHNFVKSVFVSSTNENEKKVGEYLKNLWRQRKKADYNDYYKVGYSKTKNIYVFANQAFSVLAKIIP